MHKPPRQGDLLRQNKVNTTIDAATFVMTASSMARCMRLDVMDNASMEILEIMIPNCSVEWFGIAVNQRIEILLDSWRRMWRILIIANHDVARITNKSILFISTIADVKIQDPPLLNESLDALVCHNIEVFNL